METVSVAVELIEFVQGSTNLSISTAKQYYQHYCVPALKGKRCW